MTFTTRLRIIFIHIIILLFFSSCTEGGKKDLLITDNCIGKSGIKFALKTNQKLSPADRDILKNDISTSSDGISVDKLLNYFIARIDTVFDSARQQVIYEAIISDSTFLKIFRSALLLYILIQIISFLIGVNPSTQGEVLSKAIKITILLFFITDSNAWVNYDNYVVQFFKTGALEFTKEISGIFVNSKKYLSTLTLIVQFIIEPIHILKVLSILLSSFLIGIGYVLIYGLSLWFLIKAIFFAIMMHATINLFITLLFTLAPMLIPLTLFKSTFQFFQKWLATIISLSLQFIILHTVVAFFGYLIYIFLTELFSFRACYRPFLYLEVPELNWRLPVAYFFIASPKPIFIDFISFYILTGLFLQSIQKLPNMASAMYSGGVNMVDNFINSTIKAFKNIEPVNKIVGKAKKKANEYTKKGLSFVGKKTGIYNKEKTKKLAELDKKMNKVLLDKATSLKKEGKSSSQIKKELRKEVKKFIDENKEGLNETLNNKQGAEGMLAERYSDSVTDKQINELSKRSAKDLASSIENLKNNSSSSDELQDKVKEMLGNLDEGLKQDAEEESHSNANSTDKILENKRLEVANSMEKIQGINNKSISKMNQDEKQTLIDKYFPKSPDNGGGSGGSGG